VADLVGSAGQVAVVVLWDDPVDNTAKSWCLEFHSPVLGN
jgi:hypothetical protein